MPNAMPARTMKSMMMMTAITSFCFILKAASLLSGTGLGPGPLWVRKVRAVGTGNRGAGAQVEKDLRVATGLMLCGKGDVTRPLGMRMR